MPRYKLTLEYDGRAYAGWQRQAELPSVQAALERAIFAFSGEAVTLGVAGRTDSGVHATGQVAHVILTRHWNPFSLREAANAHLVNEGVKLLLVEEVSAGFDARFSARERRYLYRILNRAAPPALLKGQVWHVSKPLDLGLMREAAAHFIGMHDFTTFRASACQAKSPVKTMDEITVEQADEEIHLRFRSRSFLHRQVRSMTGSLKQVGEGKFPPGWISDILAAKDRKVCGVVAPADGLYLTQVIYDEEKS